MRTFNFVQKSALYAAMLMLANQALAATAVGLNFAYSSGGGQYYPQTVINGGAAVNSLYQIGGCFPGANYNNGFNNGFPGGYNTPPYANYPVNYPNYMPQMPPIMPTLPGSSKGSPIIAPFHGSTFVPPHIAAANRYNAPYFNPGPGCGVACGGGFIQQPIFPVAGGPLVDTGSSRGIYQYGNGNALIDLRDDSVYNFSSGLWATASVFNAHAPNVGVPYMPQQPLRLNIPDSRTGSREYILEERH